MLVCQVFGVGRGSEGLSGCGWQSWGERGNPFPQSKCSLGSARVQ